jgi:hypothetical protein
MDVDSTEEELAPVDDMVIDDKPDNDASMADSLPVKGTMSDTEEVNLSESLNETENGSTKEQQHIHSSDSKIEVCQTPDATTADPHEESQSLDNSMESLPAATLEENESETREEQSSSVESAVPERRLGRRRSSRMSVSSKTEEIKEDATVKSKEPKKVMPKKTPASKGRK